MCGWAKTAGEAGIAGFQFYRRHSGCVAVLCAMNPGPMAERPRIFGARQWRFARKGQSTLLSNAI